MHMLRSFFLLTLSALFTFSLQSQIDGDNIFSQDQVVTIDLMFDNANFWTTLTSNYTADLNEYIPAHLTITDVTGSYEMDSVGIRLKGNSSYSHPGNKKSFKIDFNKFVSEQNYDGLKKLNLSNGFKDPTCIREKIFFDICREVGVPAPRASFANVTMNGAPWGFYTIVEQIDDQFLDWKILDDDGNLFKAGDNFGGGGPGGGGGAEADLMYYGTAQTSYEDRYELKTNEDVNDWTDLINLIDFINNSSDELFEAELGNRIELTEYLRTVALDNLFGNLDSYTGSARNYYVYHNSTTGLWQWIKWDGNESFGSYANGVNNMTSLAPNYSNADRPLLENIFDNDNLYAQYLFEMCYITENFFNSEHMEERIDEVTELVEESVFADNNKMYSNANFTTNITSNITLGGGPGGGTIYGLKNFVNSRTFSILNTVDCSLYTGIEENESSVFSLFPNPVEDELRIIHSDESNAIESLRITDITGREAMTVLLSPSELSQTELTVDVSTLKDGVYVMSIFYQDGRTQARKFQMR